jgi:hypothetical protein
MHVDHDQRQEQLRTFESLLMCADAATLKAFKHMYEVVQLLWCSPNLLLLL